MTSQPSESRGAVAMSPTAVLGFARESTEGRMKRNGFLQAMLAVGLLIAAATSAAAEGALALGVPDDVAKEGFSYGTATDRSSGAEAREVALNGCRTNRDGSKQSQKLCAIYDTFIDKCVSVAMDPKAGTPGVGWAVSADSATSDQWALTMCRATAGAGRQGYCKVTTTNCESSTK